MLFRFVLLACALAVTSLSSADQIEEKAPKLSQESIAKTAKYIVDTYQELGWFSGSVLLAKDDEIFFEKSYGYANVAAKNENTQSTKFNLGSIMKNFTKVLILQQVEKEKLSLTDTLDKFALGFPQAVSKKITIEHLLNHRSGFGDIFIAEYRENPLSFDSLDKKLDLLKNRPLLFEPGTDYRYSNYGYVVLGAILERVTNQSFEQLLSTNIFKQVGLKNTSFKVIPTDENQSVRYTYLYDGTIQEVGVTEHPGPDGGIESTAADIQKFYRELFYGNRIINPSNPLVRKAFAMDGEHWGSYGGGVGVSAAVEVNLADGIEIVVLANTDSLVAEFISNRIHSFVKTGTFEKISDRETNYAYKFYREKGKDNFYQTFKDEYSKAGYSRFIGRTINELGMQLLQTKAWTEAFDVFNYLVHIFPNAPQAYDSLSFAYFSKGELSKAKETYKKALAINAGFNSDYVSDNYGHL